MPAEFEEIMEYLLFLAVNQTTAHDVRGEFFFVLKEKNSGQAGLS
jgi:hypothetical protein